MCKLTLIMCKENIVRFTWLHLACVVLPQHVMSAFFENGTKKIQNQHEYKDYIFKHLYVVILFSYEVKNVKKNVMLSLIIKYWIKTFFQQIFFN